MPPRYADSQPDAVLTYTTGMQRALQSTLYTLNTRAHTHAYHHLSSSKSFNSVFILLAPSFDAPSFIAPGFFAVPPAAPLPDVPRAGRACAPDAGLLLVVAAGALTSPPSHPPALALSQPSLAALLAGRDVLVAAGLLVDGFAVKRARA